MPIDIGLMLEQCASNGGYEDPTKDKIIQNYNLNNKNK